MEPEGARTRPLYMSKIREVPLTNEEMDFLVPLFLARAAGELGAKTIENFVNLRLRQEGVPANQPAGISLTDRKIVVAEDDVATNLLRFPIN